VIERKKERKIRLGEPAKEKRQKKRKKDKDRK
jgi:hypothetical protein